VIGSCSDGIMHITRISTWDVRQNYWSSNCERRKFRAKEYLLPPKCQFYIKRQSKHAPLSRKAQRDQTVALAATLWIWHQEIFGSNLDWFLSCCSSGMPAKCLDPISTGPRRKPSYILCFTQNGMVQVAAVLSYNFEVSNLNVTRHPGYFDWDFQCFTIALKATVTITLSRDVSRLRFDWIGNRIYWTCWRSLWLYRWLLHTNTLVYSVTIFIRHLVTVSNGGNFTFHGPLKSLPTCHSNSQTKITSRQKGHWPLIALQLLNFCLLEPVTAFAWSVICRKLPNNWSIRQSTLTREVTLHSIIFLVRLPSITQLRGTMY
jgi:hypothetical protein